MPVSQDAMIVSIVYGQDHMLLRSRLLLFMSM